ncbi:AvrD family protein [Streptomyces decoyicus]|uniref:AvrD family protein n=1 Tax=Streptomyces decoyicus TaxID=249567 RepID=UPI0033B6C5E8
MSWVDDDQDDSRTDLAPVAGPGDPRSTVDDYLGPGERRFFGQGYKRAEQRLSDISVGVRPDGKGFARGAASVLYPADWSRKGKTDQPPHLSTIDVLLIAGELAELYLVRALGLSPAQRSELRLRRVRIKAGSAPVEEELAEFGVTAVIDAAERKDGAAGEHGLLVSSVDAKVGALRVRLDVEHPPGSATPPPDFAEARYATPDDLLGPAALRPYARLHATKTQFVEDLTVDVPHHTAHARTWTLSTAPADLTPQGLESGTFRSTSLIDAFVVVLQLGQIVLYELDEVPRAESNTMWMRQTVIEVGEPQRPLTEPGRVTVRLADLELLTTADGETWRSADIVGALDHLAIRVSIAHRLP